MSGEDDAPPRRPEHVPELIAVAAADPRRLRRERPRRSPPRRIASWNSGGSGDRDGCGHSSAVIPTPITYGTSSAQMSFASKNVERAGVRVLPTTGALCSDHAGEIGDIGPRALNCVLFKTVGKLVS